MSALLFKNKTWKQKYTFSPVNTKASIQQILTVRLTPDAALLIQVAEWITSPSCFKLTRATVVVSGLPCQNKCITNHLIKGNGDCGIYLNLF